MVEDDEMRTADPEKIRAWVEDRDGNPAIVVDEGDHSEKLLFDFPGENIDQDFQEISWEEFFDEFDQRDLVFVYGEEFGEPGQEKPPIREKYDIVDKSEQED